MKIINTIYEFIFYVLCIGYLGESMPLHYYLAENDEKHIIYFACVVFLLTIIIILDKLNINPKVMNVILLLCILGVIAITWVQADILF